MNQNTKNQINGKLHEVSGALKEAGKAANDPDLTAEGQVERLGGILHCVWVAGAATILVPILILYMLGMVH
jgi:hypothetical protein